MELQHKYSATRRYLLLLLLLVGFGYLKIEHAPHGPYHTQLDPWADGGYYYEIAQHVRDGDGLVTNVSLMHKGYPHFPHPTSVYPVWPLVLGLLARVIPLEHLAIKLPAALYLLSLVFAYLFGQRLLPRPFFPRALPAFDAGHVIVLIVGLHVGYFQGTSFPLTEALSYALLFGGLWAFLDSWERPSFRRGAAFGLWLAALLLARSQFAIVVLAVVVATAVAIAVAVERRAQVLLGVGLAVGFLPLVVWHYVFIASFIPDAGPMSLLRFDQNRATETLSQIPVMVRTRGLWEYLQDRAGGFVVAWDPDGRESFSAAFHCFHYALPIALLVLLVRAAARRPSDVVRRVAAWLRAPTSARWIFVSVLALIGYLSIHAIHKATWSAWNFSLRQGLTCVFLFFLPYCLLLRSRLSVALVAVGLLVMSTVVGVQRVYELDTGPLEDWPPRPELARFLERERSEAGSLTIAMQAPHRFAPYVSGVGIHAVVRTATTVDDLRRMVDELGVRYVVLPSSRRGWRILRRGSPFYRSFKPVRSIDDLTIWAPISATSRPGQDTG